MSDKLRTQYVLRVKHGSEVDRAMRALQEGPKTAEELRQIGGLSRTPYIMRQFGNWFDNVSVDTSWGKTEGEHSIQYTDIMPNQVTIQTQGVEFGGAETSFQSSAVDMETKMQWPMAPPIIPQMEEFDEPSWFKTMETMVNLGKHIALEGPPGVGKDTAVEQLAARCRKPLVTIGGDAGFRKRDLIGSPQMSNGTSYWQVAEYVAAAINGWWVLLSEVNAADPDALIYINTQLAPPHIVTFQGKAYPVHPDFRIFVSYNHGLIGTKPLPQSFKDRFFPIKVPFFSEYQLRRRLQAMGMPSVEDDITKLKGWQDPPPVSDPEKNAWTETVVKFGVAMWDAHKRGQMRYQITTRRLIDAVDLYVADPDISIKDALTAAVIGAIDSPVEADAADTVLRSVIN